MAKPISHAFCDPAIASRAPRRDHGCRADVERDGFSIQIVHRGEQLSYIDAVLGEVIAEIFIAGDWIDADSILAWDGERQVTDLERVTCFWATVSARPLHVIRSSHLAQHER